MTELSSDAPPRDAARFVFSYVPTAGESARAGLVMFVRAPVGRLFGAAFALLALVPAARALWIGGGAGAAVRAFLPGAVGGGLFMALAVAMTYWRARQYMRSNPSLTSQHTAELSPEGYRMRTPTGERLLAWDGIVRVAETREFFLLYVGGMAAFFFPRRAVPPARLDELRAFLAEHAGRGGARSAPAPLPLPALDAEPGAVSATFVLREDEAYRAHRVVAGGRWKRLPWVFFLGMPVLLVWLETLNGATVLQGFREHLALILLLWAMPVVGLAASRWEVRQSLRTSLMAGPQTVTLADSGVRGGNAAGGGVSRWDAIVRARETDEFFLFYVARQHAFILPKRAMADRDLPRVRALLRAHVRGPVTLEDDLPPA